MCGHNYAKKLEVERLKNYRDAALNNAVKASSESLANGFLKIAEQHEQRIIKLQAK